MRAENCLSFPLTVLLSVCVSGLPSTHLIYMGRTTVESSGHFDQLSHRVADSIPDHLLSSLDHFHHRFLSRFHRKIYCPPLFISKVISYLVILFRKLRSHRITCPPQNACTVRRKLYRTHELRPSRFYLLSNMSRCRSYSPIITDQFLLGPNHGAVETFQGSLICC